MHAPRGARVLPELGPALAAQPSAETTLLLRVCHASDSVPGISGRRRGIAAAPLSPPAFFPPRISFSCVVRALMFISLGVSSPAQSRRFHTFLLANSTVLLPAAEGEPGAGDPQTALVLPPVLLLIGSGRLKGAGEGRDALTCLITRS